MVQILEPGYSFGSEMGKALRRGADTSTERRQKMKEMAAQQDQQMKQAMLVEAMKGQQKEHLQQKKMEQLKALFSQGGLQQDNSSQGMMNENIPLDEQILGATAIDPNVGRVLQHQKDVNLREKSVKEGREFEKYKLERHEENEIAKPLLLELNDARKNVPLQEQAIQDIKNASSGVSPLDYIADVTGFEPLRSSKGAQFKTAIKDFFLSDLTRAGARPNQWIEQQLMDALPKIGRSPEANLITAEGMQFKVDLAKRRIDILDELSQKDMKDYGYVKGRTLDSRASQLMKPYIEQRKKDLINQITSIKKGKHKSNQSENQQNNMIDIVGPDGKQYEIDINEIDMLPEGYKVI